MADWAWWTLGIVFGLFAAAKLIFCGWTIYELRTKWRTVPELCGLDWLDIVYRVEHESGAKLTAADFERLSPSGRADLTAGQFWEVIRAKMPSGRSAADGWARLAGHLANAHNRKPWQVTPEARLIADLGMSNEYD